ncbi:MAG: YkgJ family cysteine cluster protein [Bacteroidota bacterium]
MEQQEATNHLNVQKKATDASEANRDFISRLKRRPPKDLDERFHDVHDELMSAFDCLSCANCCKTLSPAIHDRDVERLARFLKMKPSALTEKYLELDADGDYVFRETPCPFLLPDNYCSVYEARPKACREYPHTDRRKMVQILDLTYRNSFTCPVVFDVLAVLRKQK